MKQPTTLREKRAVEFGVALLTCFGYGYTISVPSRQLAKELTTKGYPISYITTIEYFKKLVEMGWATREMTAKMFGVTYKLNRYAFKKLLAE